MSRHRLLPVLAALAVCAAPDVQAQPAAPVARDTGAAPPRVAPPTPAFATTSIPGRRDPAARNRSVTEKLFDARWVVFPARLALVIVFSAVAMLLLMGGTWAGVRVAHALWHLRWKEPPRRLRRAEVGAAGTTLALELEDRLQDKVQQDAERDQQIATLRDRVAHLYNEHEELAATVAAMGKKGRRGRANGSADRD